MCTSRCWQRSALSAPLLYPDTRVPARSPYSSIWLAYGHSNSVQKSHASHAFAQIARGNSPSPPQPTPGPHHQWTSTMLHPWLPPSGFSAAFSVETTYNGTYTPFGVHNPVCLALGSRKGQAFSEPANLQTKGELQLGDALLRRCPPAHRWLCGGDTKSSKLRRSPSSPSSGARVRSALSSLSLRTAANSLGVTDLLPPASMCRPSGRTSVAKERRSLRQRRRPTRGTVTRPTSAALTAARQAAARREVATRKRPVNAVSEVGCVVGHWFPCGGSSAEQVL